MKQSFEFSYKLSYEECYETFLLLSMKWSRKIRKLIGGLLILITIILLAGYFFDSTKIHYFVMSILAILLLYYLIYVPVLKAKKGAIKVSKAKGTYKVKITEDGMVVTDTESMPLASDKDARAIETEQLYILRPDRMHTICLPKRVMNEQEKEAIRNILKANVKYQIR